MKKVAIVIITLIFAIGYSTVSMAADWSDAGADLTVNGTTVHLSNGVHGIYQSSTSAYSAATYNERGTKAYGVAANSNVKYEPCTNDDCANNAPAVPGTNGNSSDFGNGWSDL